MDTRELLYICAVWSERDDPIHYTLITFHYNEEGDGPPSIPGTAPYNPPNILALPSIYSTARRWHNAGPARSVPPQRNAPHRPQRSYCSSRRLGSRPLAAASEMTRAHPPTRMDSGCRDARFVLMAPTSAVLKPSTVPAARVSTRHSQVLRQSRGIRGQFPGPHRLKTVVGTS
jgi:hypothetical protein